MWRGDQGVGGSKVVRVSQEIGREECQGRERDEKNGEAHEVLVGKVWVEGDLVRV